MKTSLIRRSCLAAALVAASFTCVAAFAQAKVALEVVIAKPKAGVSLEKLIAADKKMEQDFVSKQKGFLSREVAVSKDGELFVVVHWATLQDAETAGAAFMTAPSAKPRMEMSDTSLFKHFVVQ